MLLGPIDQTQLTILHISLSWEILAYWGLMIKKRSCPFHLFWQWKNPKDSYEKICVNESSCSCPLVSEQELWWVERKNYDSTIDDKSSLNIFSLIFDFPTFDNETACWCLLWCVIYSCFRSISIRSLCLNFEELHNEDIFCYCPFVLIPHSIEFPL